MTTTPAAPYDSPRLTEVLRVYADDPLDDGDVVLLVDDAVCLEVAGLASQWDEVLRRNTGRILRETASRVVVAIARPGAELLPRDYRLWRELHEEVRGTAVELLPVQALPAA
jgi:hypothetical protein